MSHAPSSSSSVRVARGAALVRGGLALAGLASVLLAASAANAKPEYTGYIFEAIPEMVCVPQCIICHTDNQGGADTWQYKAFGRAGGGTVSGGARGTGLLEAIKMLDSDPIPLGVPDAKTDGILDVTRLQGGRDPNTVATDTTSICAPAYGCGARIAPAASINSHAAGAALLSGLVLVGLMLRRRR